MRRRWRVLLAVVVGFAVFAVLARTTLPGRVTGGALAESVAAGVGSTSGLLGDDEPCRRTARAGEWRCDVYDASGSGGVGYRVRVDGSCWRARLTADYGEGGTRRRAGGCVRLWQWSLLDLL